MQTASCRRDHIPSSPRELTTAAGYFIINRHAGRTCETRSMTVFAAPCFEPTFREHPIVLADVGARGGLRPNWRSARPQLRLLGFEPDRGEYDRLVADSADGGHGDRYFNVALHDHRGSMTLHVARDPGLTSLFPPNRPFLDAFPDADRFDTVDRVSIATDTLDRIVAEHQIEDVDFIKADTQGTELFVLRGATGVLASQVTGVEVEAEFAQIYSGQPVFADVDTLLRDLGFHLFDLRPCYWKRAAGRSVGGPHGQIIWADALYLKGVQALQSSTAGLAPHPRKAKWLKAMSVALLYGYRDYALEIAHSVDIWSTDEVAAIERELRRGDSASLAVPFFPGRRYVAAGFRRLSRAFRDRNDAWSVSDANLGNLE